MEENMEGRVESRWKTLRRLLSFKGIRWCGSIWGRSGSSSQRLTLSDGEYEEYSDLYDQHVQRQQQQEEEVGSHFDQEISISSAQEIGALLATERELRAATGAASAGGQAPLIKVSLMRLLEEREERERDGSCYDEAAEEEGEAGEGSSSCCCVCMGRRKGAAFIPCGHTFCRTCARELWTSRRSCPLCNRLILEILDIF